MTTRPQRAGVRLVHVLAMVLVTSWSFAVWRALNPRESPCRSPFSDRGGWAVSTYVALSNVMEDVNRHIGMRGYCPSGQAWWAEVKRHSAWSDVRECSPNAALSESEGVLFDRFGNRVLLLVGRSHLESTEGTRVALVSLGPNRQLDYRLGMTREECGDDVFCERTYASSIPDRENGR